MRDRAARRSFHRQFHDARVNETIYTQAAHTSPTSNDRPTLTIFGSLGDYLGFQKRWRKALPAVTQIGVLGTKGPCPISRKGSLTWYFTWMRTEVI